MNDLEKMRAKKAAARAHNDMLVKRIVGMPVTAGDGESDRDPRDPTATTGREEPRQ